VGGEKVGAVHRNAIKVANCFYYYTQFT